MTNKAKTILYVFLLLLFVLSLALHITNGLKSGDFEYIKIIISAFAVGLALFQIVTLRKLEKNK